MVYTYLSNFFKFCMAYVDYSFTNYAVRNNMHFGPHKVDTRQTFRFYKINDDWKNT